MKSKKSMGQIACIINIVINIQYCWFSEKKILISLFRIENLNKVHPRMPCTQFGLNGPVVLIFLNFVNLFFLFHSYLPFGKQHNPLVEQIWVLFTQGCFWGSLVKFGQKVLEKKNTNVKSLQQRQTMTSFNQKSSLEPLAKVSWKMTFVLK